MEEKELREGLSDSRVYEEYADEPADRIESTEATPGEPEEIRAEEKEGEKKSNRNLVVSLIYGVVMFVIIFGACTALYYVVGAHKVDTEAGTHEDMGDESAEGDMAKIQAEQSSQDLTEKLAPALQKLEEIKSYNANSEIKDRSVVVAKKGEIYEKMVEDVQGAIAATTNETQKKKLEALRNTLRSSDTKRLVTQTSGSPYFNLTREADDEINKLKEDFENAMK